MSELPCSIIARRSFIVVPPCAYHQQALLQPVCMLLLGCETAAPWVEHGRHLNLDKLAVCVLQLLARQELIQKCVFKENYYETIFH